MISYKTALLKKINSLNNTFDQVYDYIIYSDPNEKIIGVVLINTNQHHYGMTEHKYKSYLVQIIYFLRGQEIILPSSWKDFKREYKLRIESDRALEKQASRIKDEEDLRSGDKTKDDLKKENGIFHGMKFTMDLNAVEKLY